jgi:hypothetical protein
MEQMRILAKRIDKNYTECMPFDSGWVTVIVKGVDLNEDNVGEFLYHNSVNVGDYHGESGQYFQNTYWRFNASKTRARIHINYGYDV